MSDQQEAKPRDEFLSIVIPAYNEEKRIPSTIEKISEYMKGRFRGFEILVVDGGSRDYTVTFVRRMIFKFPAVRIIKNEHNMGKGHAVRAGVMEARGELILVSDADLSTPISELEKLMARIDGGADIAIGSRRLKGSELMIPQPWYRERMGRIFNILVRTLVMGGIMDTQCGFKLLRREPARRIFGLARLNGFAFEVEALYLARILGYKTSEVPVIWLDSPSSRLSPVGDPINMVSDLFRIRLNRILKRYTS